jgi:hypothetical protein
MGDWVCLVWKAPGCFRACARLIRRYEKVDKIAGRAFRGIFACSISIPGLYSPLLVVLVLRSFCRIQVRKSQKEKTTGIISRSGEPCENIVCQDLSGDAPCRGIDPDKEEFFVIDIHKHRLFCRHNMHMADGPARKDRE